MNILRTAVRPRLVRPCLWALLPLLVLAGARRSEAQTKAYVVHGGADVVSAIDTGTGTVAGTFGVGAGAARVTITRDGTRAYVTNGGSNSISAIDTATDTVLGAIPVGDSPSALAVTPDGKRLYVMTAGGVVEVVDTALQTVVASIPVGSGDTSGIAIAPDGARAYVASGLVYVVDTATNTVVRSFAAEQAPIPDVTHTASSIALSPDGARAYVGVVTFNFTGGNFSAGGNLVVVDTASDSIAATINLFSLPGAIAVTPDGSRVYVGMQYKWANTGYGAAFFPGRLVFVVDALTNQIASFIDLGADGSNWTEQNSPAGIGVTADRGAVYVAVPRLGVVAVAGVSTNAVTSVIPVTAGPGDLAVARDDTVALVPYTVDAVDDGGTIGTLGGTVIASVLANDRLGGIRATVAHVILTQMSSTSDGIAVDPATGAVEVAPGTAVGIHALVYRICEKAAAANCDEATVTATVRAEYAIDAVDDSGSTVPGWTALASVLANDTLGGTPAAGRVAVSLVSSTSGGITLDLASGAVSVAFGTPIGSHALTYRICDVESPANCDTATVAITVRPFPIDARNDAAAAPRTGGTALASVLANDTFNGAPATLAKVRLSPVASTSAGIALDVASGAVTVASGTPVGTYSLPYRLCEIVTPSNCDEATVTVAVQPLLIVAGYDAGSGSSKVANTPIARVLANDRIGGAPATTANVRLSLVSITPANDKIRLDPADGSVDVLGKTSSGLFTLVYQICEIAMPANCGQGTARIDLSGH